MLNVQQSLFDETAPAPARVPKRLTNRHLIRSVSDCQFEILRWITRLYCPNGFDLDCTYRVGGFYKAGVPAPRLKMDIAPRTRKIMPADVRHLPFKPECLQSVVFDPPFLPAGSKTCRLRQKYGAFENMRQLWRMYTTAMQEIARVLKPNGVLVFKCQDSVCGRTQYLVHADIIRFAQRINLYPKDLFIKLASHVPIGWNQHTQQHARKTHCYFIVFIKKRRRITRIEER